MSHPPPPNPPRTKKRFEVRKAASYKSAITPLELLVIAASFDIERARKKGWVR